MFSAIMVGEHSKMSYSYGLEATGLCGISLTGALESSLKMF